MYVIKWKVLVLLVLHPLFSYLNAVAGDTLRVGIKEAPPFTIKTENGWEGLNVALWKGVETELGIASEFVEMDMSELTKSLSNGTIDAGLGAITVNQKREEQFNFSSVYYLSGLGLMVNSKSSGAWALFTNVISGNFLKVVVLLCLLLLLVGFAIWIVERRKNPEEFQPGWRGVFAGFWWSAVTMTTVGYGDKSPKTGLGRMVGLIWMFASLIMISYFTASMASALTVNEIGISVSTVADLHGVRAGVIKGTVAEQYLVEHRIAYKSLDNLEGLVNALEKDEIEVVIADYPILKYYLHNHSDKGLEMLPHKPKSFFYAIGLRDGLELNEELNRAVLSHTESSTWSDQLFEYFGDID